jgi:hypothetical protein
MRTLRILITLFAAAAASPAAHAQEASLNSLSWLAGCWAPESGEPGSVEHWLPPAGGTMLATSRTIKNGKTVEYEFIGIHTESDGRIVYTARPSRQRETSFVASSIGSASAIFENPSHDFPQRVIYRLRPDGGLAARIEGVRCGNLRHVDFPMKRVSCDTELKTSVQK